jgi:hypothetical protein
VVFVTCRRVNVKKSPTHPAHSGGRILLADFILGENMTRGEREKMVSERKKEKEKRGQKLENWS